MIYCGRDYYRLGERLARRRAKRQALAQATAETAPPAPLDAATDSYWRRAPAAPPPAGETAPPPAAAVRPATAPRTMEEAAAAYWSWCQRARS